MTTITVTPQQIAAAKLQMALDKVDGRKSDPRVVQIAKARATARAAEGRPNV